MPINVATLEDAISTIEQLQDGSLLPDELELSGEMSRLQIVVTGEKYHHSVPAELARGLWEYQEALNKAVAFAFTGVDDARKLREQKEKFELVFTVEEGSSKIEATLKPFIEALGEGFKKMDSKKRLIILLTFLVLVAGGLCTYKALDVSADVKKEEIKATLARQTEQEKTRQFEIIAGLSRNEPIIQKFDKAAEDGTKAIVRGASDAENVRVGRGNFDRGNIQEITQRAPRTASIGDIVDASFRVFTAESRHEDSTRYILNSVTEGKVTGEFTVIVNHSEMAAADLEKLWQAAMSRTPVHLEVSLVKNRGAVRAAQIVTVF